MLPITSSTSEAQDLGPGWSWEVAAFQLQPSDFWVFLSQNMGLSSAGDEEWWRWNMLKWSKHHRTYTSMHAKCIATSLNFKTAWSWGVDFNKVKCQNAGLNAATWHMFSLLPFAQLGTCTDCNTVVKPGQDSLCHKNPHLCAQWLQTEPIFEPTNTRIVWSWAFVVALEWPETFWPHER